MGDEVHGALARHLNVQIKGIVEGFKRKGKAASVSVFFPDMSASPSDAVLEIFEMFLKELNESKKVLAPKQLRDEFSGFSAPDRANNYSLSGGPVYADR